MDINDLIGIMLEITTLMGIPPVHDLPGLIELPKTELREKCGSATTCYIRPNIYYHRRIPDYKLVHEATHHIQEMTGRWGLVNNCSRFKSREEEAYEVHIKWATLHDISVSSNYSPIYCEE